MIVLSHADEGKLQSLRFSHKVRDAGVDILEACATSHELEHVRSPHCTASSEVSARTPEPMGGALEAGGVSRRDATAYLSEHTGYFRAQDFRKLSQQIPVSFEACQYASHVKCRFWLRRDIRLQGPGCRRDARKRLDECKELRRVYGLGQVFIGAGG